MAIQIVYEYMSGCGRISPITRDGALATLRSSNRVEGKRGVVRATGYREFRTRAGGAIRVWARPDREDDYEGACDSQAAARAEA